MVVSMLANIIYYGTDKSSSPDALKIGPFMITPTQVRDLIKALEQNKINLIK
jgi:hypothetical protein